MVVQLSLPKQMEKNFLFIIGCLVIQIATHQAVVFVYHLSNDNRAYSVRYMPIKKSNPKSRVAAFRSA